MCSRTILTGKKTSPKTYRAIADSSNLGLATASVLERTRIPDMGHSFVGKQRPLAMFDLPWMPLYLLCAYLLHAYLGAIAVAGACVLAVLPVATEFLTRSLAGAVHRAAIARNAAAESTASNADILKATASATDAAIWLVAYDRRANGEYSVIRGNVGGDNVVKLCVNFRSRRGFE